MDKRKSFLWFVPCTEEGRMRPIAMGFDILTPIFGVDGFTLTGEPLPDLTCASGVSTEEGAAFLKKVAQDAGADYVIIEGCPLRVLVELVLDEDFYDRILVPTRGNMGMVEKFSIVQAELATKPFPEE